MDKLQKKGYKKFLKEYYSKNKRLFKELSDKQNPDTMVITCSDSRINPSLLLQANPGELFICRNIGNVVPHYQPSYGSTQAAIEYAVNILNVKKIVILGHSNCGACSHVLNVDKHHDHKKELQHIDNWLENIIPAKNMAMLEVNADPKKNIFQLTEKHNIISSLRRLMEYPYIQKRLLTSELELLGWWYDIKTAIIENYNFSTNKFEEVI